ncbi:MAG: hypothetical protein N838_22855 [Thiohalocapsa sp. PB-PSB1]|nr:MAG: hypothetical protein N838_22855 [Thiohalocapsa sp. PB-PSB1]
MSLMIPFDVPAQRAGLIRGARHQGDRQPRAGRRQRLCPGRGGAILGRLLQQDAVRHRLERHQADRRVEGLIIRRP